MDKVRKHVIDSNRPATEKFRILSLLARDEDFRLSCATEAGGKDGDRKLSAYIDRKLERTPRGKEVEGGVSDDATDIEALFAATDAYMLEQVETLTDPANLKRRAEAIVDEAVESYVFQAFGLVKTTIDRDGERHVEVRMSSKADDSLKKLVIDRVKAAAESNIKKHVDRAVEAFDVEAHIKDGVGKLVEELFEREVEVAARKIATERAKTRVERGANSIRNGYGQGV